jgi:hypothetical protein
VSDISCRTGSWRWRHGEALSAGMLSGLGGKESREKEVAQYITILNEILPHFLYISLNFTVLSTLIWNSPLWRRIFEQNWQSYHWFCYPPFHNSWRGCSINLIHLNYNHVNIIILRNGESTNHGFAYLRQI